MKTIDEPGSFQMGLFDARPPAQPHSRTSKDAAESIEPNKTNTMIQETDTNTETQPASSTLANGSAVYEIANPSDAYTIKAPFLVAAVAVAILGNGKYGIPGSPVLFGWDKWLKENVGDLGEYIDKHRTEIADALDSVLIGSESDRMEVESALSLIPTDQHEQWLSKSHDRRCTSMNNIGSNARQIANQLRQPPNDEHSGPAGENQSKP